MINSLSSISLVIILWFDRFHQMSSTKRKKRGKEKERGNEKEKENFLPSFADLLLVVTLQLLTKRFTTLLLPLFYTLCRAREDSLWLSQVLYSPVYVGFIPYTFFFFFAQPLPILLVYCLSYFQSTMVNLLPLNTVSFSLVC